MKGWHRHGVCSQEAWPDTDDDKRDCYTEQRARAALRNPLGASFRVNHKDLVAMRAAFAEVGVLYASGAVRSEEHTSELQSLMRISYAVFCLKTNKITET